MPGVRRRARGSGCVKFLLRIFLNLATVASLLLALATAALWARSYWVTHFVGHSNHTSWVGALSMAGLLRFEHGNYPTDGPNYAEHPTPKGGLWHEVEARDRRGGRFQRAGFALG